MRLLRFSAIVATTALTWAITPNSWAEYYLGEMFVMPGDFCPMGSAAAAGQSMEIAQNSALFALLGTNYGGDGRIKFNLPDMKGKVPIGVGKGPGLTNRTIGMTGGSSEVTIEVPSHTHNLNVATSDSRNTPDPEGGYISSFGSAVKTYTPSIEPSDEVEFSDLAIGYSGTNMSTVSTLQPIIYLQWCIATVGTFPPRS